MRILTLIDSLGPGGRERTAQNYVQGYVESGHETAVCAVVKGGPRRHHLLHAGAEVFVGGESEAEQREALEASIAWGPDVVHLHSEGPPAPQIARAVSYLRAQVPDRLPVIETSSFGKVDYRQRYACSDIHLLKGRWMLWKWTKWSRPFTPTPIGVVVPNTVDTDTFVPAPPEGAAFRTRLGIPETAYVFGRVGQASIWKWSRLALDAFAQVASRHERAWLCLIGLPDELRPVLEAYPAEIRERVVELAFIDNDDELRACYNSFDVFLHASQIGESFGMVLAESMACGCPVITHSTPANDNSQVEVVGHRHGGLVVHTLRGMVEAMEVLMKDKALHATLGDQGRMRVVASYTLASVLPQLSRILELVTTCATHAELADAVAHDSALTSHVPDEAISALLKDVQDPPTVKQRMLTYLVHQPLAYRLWRSYKFR